MLLLNVVRVVITLVAMLLIETARRAWDLAGFGLIGMLAFGMLLAFIAGDVAEQWLIEYFEAADNETGTTGS